MAYLCKTIAQVGKNLHVLSQLDGVDLEMYKDVVLPRVLEQVSLIPYLVSSEVHPMLQGHHQGQNIVAMVLFKSDFELDTVVPFDCIQKLTLTIKFFLMWWLFQYDGN